MWCGEKSERAWFNINKLRNRNPAGKRFVDSSLNDLWQNFHDDVIKWKHFPRKWPFVREIHRSPVNFPHKGQWRGALMFSLIYAWINDWVNNREAGDLRRQHGHYDVIVMVSFVLSIFTASMVLVHTGCFGMCFVDTVAALLNRFRTRMDGRLDHVMYHKHDAESFVFNLKSCSGTKIGLYSPFYGNEGYFITLGGGSGSNRWDGISKQEDLEPDVKVTNDRWSSTGQCETAADFWVSWDNKRVAAGEGRVVSGCNPIGHVALAAIIDTTILAPYRSCHVTENHCSNQEPISRDLCAANSLVTGVSEPRVCSASRFKSFYLTQPSIIQINGTMWEIKNSVMSTCLATFIKAVCPLPQTPPETCRHLLLIFIVREICFWKKNIEWPAKLVLM